MARKWIILIGAFLILTGLLAACAGPQGEPGPVGPAGPAGPEGPAGPAAVSAPTSETAEVAKLSYVGDQLCSGCHNQLAQSYFKSGHPWSLSKVVDGKTPVFPFTQVNSLPSGYTAKDISYIIGGYYWKSIFVDNQGYIITNPPGATDDTTYLNQVNLSKPALGLSSSLSSFHAGQAEFSMTCGTCHATGFEDGVSQDNLDGIFGSWAQPGVRCERCHGPGSQHAANPKEVRMVIDRDSALCQECHTYRDIPPTSLEIANGFIQHGDQYGDLSQSKHQILNCLTCHDPHTGIIQLRQENQQTTRLVCEDCHFQEAQFQSNPAHVSRGLACVDCHMPRIIQDGSANSKAFMGDFMTHVVAIDPHLPHQFTEEGTLISGQISLDFACRHCHGTTKSDEELMNAAVGYHNLPGPQVAP